MTVPVVVINMVRHAQRKHSVATELDDMGMKHIFLTGVDGEMLRRNGGRARHLHGGQVRFTWNEGSKREERSVFLGKSLVAGKSSPWGMLGCAMSHEQLA